MFFILVVSCPTGCSTSVVQPLVTPEKGVFDLRQMSLESDTTVSLDGNWEFYWNELLSPADFKNQTVHTPAYVAVPGTWTQNTSFARHGYGTYRAHILIPKIGVSYALNFHSVHLASMVWVDGIPVKKSGIVGTMHEFEIPDARPFNVWFNPKSDSVDVIIQVSNHEDLFGGILRSIHFGTTTQVVRQEAGIISSGLFLFGCVLMIGLFHLILYLCRRNDISPLLFGLFCLCMSPRSLITGDRAIHLAIDGISYMVSVRAEYFTLSAGAFLMMYVQRLFPEESNKVFVKIFTILSAVYVVITLVSPISVLVPFSLAYQIIILLAILDLIWIIILSLKRNRAGALLLLLSLVFIFVSVVNDVLHGNMVISTAFILPYGMLVFMILQSLILSMRYVNVSRSVEVLSHKLEIHAAQLEIKVEERTLELQRERNTLDLWRRRIERELSIARTIQQKLIPVEQPSPAVFSYYLPMNQVGGDFFDFFHFQDTRNIGIFLSDVSGHGIPAALITSMIKSFILQAGTCKENPCDLMWYLNDLLFSQIKGNFVTAFYCIYDPETCQIMYSNAGHNPPYIISNGSIRSLEIQNTTPLGIMSNIFLSEHEKRYVNNIITLEKGDKFVLHTDGLVDTTDTSDRTKYFGDDTMNDIMIRYAALPHNEFIEALMKEAALYHGSDSFEDDVCVICIDV